MASYEHWVRSRSLTTSVLEIPINKFYRVIVLEVISAKEGGSSHAPSGHAMCHIFAALKPS